TEWPTGTSPTPWGPPRGRSRRCCFARPTDYATGCAISCSREGGITFMRCQTARRWITTDLAGELPASRVRRLSRHVERCEGCRRERTAYAALDRLLGDLPLEASPSPRLEQDTLRRVRLAAAGEDAAEGRPWAWLKMGAPALAGAAVLLLAVRAVSPPTAPDAPTGHATPRAAS